MYYEKLEKFGLKRKTAKRSDLDDLFELVALHSNEFVVHNHKMYIISHIISKGYNGVKDYAQEFSDKLYNLLKEYHMDPVHLYFHIIKLENMEAAVATFDISTEVMSKSRYIYVKNETAPKELVYNGQASLVLEDEPYFGLSFQLYGTGRYFIPGTISFELPLHVQTTDNPECSPIENLQYHLKHLLSLYHDSQNQENKRLLQIGQLLHKGFSIDEVHSLRVFKENGQYYLETI